MSCVVDECVVVPLISEEAGHCKGGAGAHQAKDEDASPAKDLGTKDTDREIKQVQDAAVEKMQPSSIWKKGSKRSLGTK